jgi:hypothetical protein
MNPERTLKKMWMDALDLRDFGISLDHTAHWTSMAQRTVSNTLPNSASKPSLVICRDQ